MRASAAIDDAAQGKQQPEAPLHRAQRRNAHTGRQAAKQIHDQRRTTTRDGTAKGELVGIAHAHADGFHIAAFERLGSTLGAVEIKAELFKLAAYQRAITSCGFEQRRRSITAGAQAKRIADLGGKAQGIAQAGFITLQRGDGGRPFGEADEFRTFLERTGHRNNRVTGRGIKQCHDSGEAIVIKAVNAHQRAVTKHRYRPGSANQRLRILAKRGAGYCFNRHRVGAVRELSSDLIGMIARRGTILTVEQDQPDIIGPMTIERLDAGGVDLHQRTSGCRRRTATEQRQPRNDLAGDIARQAFERRGFGGNDRIVGANTINADVGAGGSIEQHGVARDINEAVAGAQCAAFASGGIVAAHPKGDNLVIKDNFQPIARVGRSGTEAVEQRLTDKKALAISDRCDFGDSEQRRGRTRAATRIDRGEIAGREREGKRQHNGRDKTPHTARR